MIKKNDNIKVEILNYGCNGEGVGKVNGQVVFVPYSLVGETEDVTIINDKNKFLIGKINATKNKSIERIDAPCPYFAKCGGCQLQHTNYLNALKIKTEIVQNATRNIGKINFEIPQCIASDTQYHYRNKLALPINAKTKKLAMYRLSSHSMVDIDDCLIQKENGHKLIGVFNKYLELTKNSIYNEEDGKGLLKTLVAREIGDKLLITVVINGDMLNDQQLLIDLLKNNFKEFGLSININKLNNNVILSSQFKHIYGLENIEMLENGIGYSINNMSFLQINDEIKSQIYQRVFDQIESDSIVIDAYSGAGMLSSLLCKHAKKVYGIEIVKQATILAEKLKTNNDIYNLENINGLCEDVLPNLLKKFSDAEKNNLIVVVDPPRKGCDKNVIESILNVLPKKVIYISCNPSTLARDLNLLTSTNNYDISTIQPFDMFPQTKHVETLAVIKKK